MERMSVMCRKKFGRIESGLGLRISNDNKQPMIGTNLFFYYNTILLLHVTLLMFYLYFSVSALQCYNQTHLSAEYPTSCTTCKENAVGCYKVSTGFIY